MCITGSCTDHEGDELIIIYNNKVSLILAATIISSQEHLSFSIDVLIEQAMVSCSNSFGAQSRSRIDEYNSDMTVK